MMRILRDSLLGAVLLVLVLAGVSRAELLGLTASVQGAVAAGEESDFAIEEFPGTTNVLPMSARAELVSEPAEGSAGAAGARGVFNDPRIGLTVLPRDFGLDAAVYTEQGELVFEAGAASSEVRRIRHSAADVGAAEGEEVELFGRFLVMGVLVVWGESGDLDLTGVEVALQLTVTQQSSGGASQEVLASSVSLVGGEGGEVELTGDGALAGAPLALVEVSGSDDFARVVLLVIPEVVLTYEYTAVVGQEYSLAAELSAELVNAGEGTGAALAIGLPLAELAEVIGGAEGEVLAEVIEATAALAELGLLGLVTIDGGQSEAVLASPWRCGSLGAEVPLGLSAMMGFMFVFMFMMPGLRRRRGSMG